MKARKKTTPAKKPRRKATGKAAGGKFVLMDVTERSEAQAALRESEGRHRAVLEDITDLVCRFRADGTFTYVNEVFCRFLGKTSEELLGQVCYPVAVEEDLPMILERLSHMSRRNPVVVIENRVYAAGGEVRWMQFVNRGFFDKRGRLLETQSVCRDVTDRRLAEEALRESEERWKFAIEGAGDGLWDWNVVTNEVFFSKRWKSMIGYGEDEIAGKFEEWRKRLHPEDLPRALAAIKAHFEGKTADYSCEFRMACKDGSWKWILARARVMSRDGAGKPLRAIGTHTDISGQKAAEEREAHNLQLIAEGAPCPAVLKAIVRSLEARDLHIMCGVVLVDAGSSTVTEVITASLPDYFKQALGNRLILSDMTCTGSAVRTGRRAVTRDIRSGKMPPPLVKLAVRAKLRACWAEPLIGSTGIVLGAIVCFHDTPHHPDAAEISAVTTAARLAALAIERRRTEEALWTSEMQCRRIVETAEEGVWTINAKSETDFVNPKMARMLGYTVVEMLGRPLHDFMDEEGRVIAERNVKRRAQGISEQHEFKFRRKDGSDLWAWLSTNPIFDPGGAYAGAIAMVTDITELKQAQAALMDREARYRSIMESQLVGLIFWNLAGDITEANDTFLQMVGYTQQDIREGRLRWSTLTPPEHRAADERGIQELEVRGFITPFEKEFFRKDGSRVPVIIGAALFPHRKGEGVSFILDITERKRVQNALSESEARYRLLSENTDDIVSLNDTKGNRLYVSPSYFRKTGWTPADLESADWRSRIHPDDIQKVESARRKNLQGEATSVEHRVRCKDGSWLWFEANCKPLRDPEGEVWRLLVWSHDITVRKQAETALRESEERYARALRGTTEGLWDWNIPTGEFYLSPRWKEMLGFLDNELPNHPDSFFKRVHPDELAQVQDAVQAHLELNEVFNIELRLRTKSGGYRWVHARGEVEWNEKGQATHMAGTISDITERRHVQELFKRQQELNKALVKHTSALIVVLNEESRVVYINPAFEKQMGYELAEIAHRPLWESGMMGAVEKPRAKERFRLLLAGQDVPPVELRLRAKNGEWHILELQPTATHRADGTIDRIILTYTDLTERARLQHEVLRISEREQATIGHNLHDGVGQTMTGIASMLEHLESGLEGEHKKQAARIRELMQQSVAEVRRMSHGLSPVAVQLRGLAGGLQLLAETIRTNYRASAVCEIDPAIDIADSEKETHLYRIAQESVNNALRHGGAKEVRLSLQRVTANECELRIEDNGAGMKNNGKSKNPGVGMSVMKYRANLIGGEVEIVSRPKRGVSVVCRFPCSAADATKKLKSRKGDKIEWSI